MELKNLSTENLNQMMAKRQRTSLLAPLNAQTDLTGWLLKNSSIRSKKAKSNSVHKTEMFFQCIDAGQKLAQSTCFLSIFIKLEKCRICEMYYDESIELDAKMHNKRCDEFTNGVKVAIGKESLDEKPIIYLEKNISHGVLVARFMLKEVETKSWAKQLLSIMNSRLGFADDNSDREEIFIAIFKSRIIGCITVESISRAFCLNPTSNNVECAAESTTAELGIRRIWVLPAMQRRGIATALLDYVRFHFSYGRVICIDKIAFSAPTIQGRSFAKSYVKNANVYVYNL